MEDPKDTFLERRLDRWAAPDPGPALNAEVWSRIARAEAASPFARLREKIRNRWFVQPAFVAMATLCCVFLTLFLVEFREARLQRERNRELADSYLRLIDPLLGPPPAATLEDHLGWMRSELGLSKPQIALIRRLHEASSRERNQHALEIAELRSANQEFENRRRAADEVDFLAFARLNEEQRILDRKCSDSAVRLVLAAAEIMDPGQRKRYLALVHPLFPGSGQKSGG